MALWIDSIKRDFARHKKKAGILGVLAVVMVLFIIKAVLEMKPATASASAVQAFAAGDSGEPAAAETPEQLKHSQELWSVLHYKDDQALTPADAFTFRPESTQGEYAADPNRKIKIEPSAAPVVKMPQSPVTSIEAQMEARRSRVQQAAAGLLIRSTVVGIDKPMAIINGNLLGVGDHILGFEITAIRAGEVEFQMDGITVKVAMANQARAR